MAESFSEIGRIEAIDQLYRLSAYNPVSGLSYRSEKGVQPDAGTVLVTPEGVEFPVKAQGWSED